jgi:transcriptional antiterminator RfaH
MEHWYAIHTKPRQEREAEAQLSRQDYRTYLPLLRASRRVRGKWLERIEPLFPRYLFIRVDLETENTAPIRSTRGVAGLVKFGLEVKPVPDLIVDGLMQTEEGGCHTPDVPVFNQGDTVTILDGGLAGLKAIYQAETAQERVHLLLDLMGRTNPITLSRHQIAPAGA